MAHQRLTQALPGMLRIAAVVVVAVGLYVARDLCIPFALAILLAFVMAPIVTRIQKWHIPRVPAVLIVMILMLTLITSGGWLVTGQIIELADQLPQYEQTIHKKLDALHAPKGGTFDRLNRMFEDLSSDFESITSQPTTSAPSSQPGTEPTTSVEVKANPKNRKPEAIEVKLATPRVSGMEMMRNLFFKAAGPLETLGVVLILTLFMLIQREDLRDRALRLLGSAQLNLSTQAIDDATGRISQYLLMQLMMNSIFGVCVTIGLFFIGVPYSPLWGLLAGCLRFMPYFGVPAAAVPPVLMAFVTSPGFWGILLTISLYVALELTICYMIEPWLYGAKTGISALAILASAFFWGWLWGPVGLLLSTPITVCLGAIGRHVPSMHFLEVMFGDTPALQPEVRFYQRLLAGDQDEAAEIAEEFLQKSSLVDLYDSLLLPALVLVEQDRARNALDEPRERFVFQSFSDLVLDMEERTPLAAATPMSNGKLRLEEGGTPAEAPHVVCVAASDEADELAARMLAGILRLRGAHVTVLAMETLAGESVTKVEELHPAVVCISAVPPHAALYARYRCKKLRGAFPELKLIVGMWTAPENPEATARRLPPELVDYVVPSIRAAADRVLSLMPEEHHPELQETAQR